MADTQHTAEDVLRWFLAWIDDSTHILDEIDEDAAHELLYFVQGYHLTHFGKPAFRNDIMATENGPLILGLDTSPMHADSVDGDEIAMLELDIDFDFDDFDKHVSQLFIEIWEGVGRETSFQSPALGSKTWITLCIQCNPETGIITQEQLAQEFSKLIPGDS